MLLSRTLASRGYAPPLTSCLAAGCSEPRVLRKYPASPYRRIILPTRSHNRQVTKHQEAAQGDLAQATPRLQTSPSNNTDDPLLSSGLPVHRTPWTASVILARSSSWRSWARAPMPRCAGTPQRPLCGRRLTAMTRCSRVGTARRASWSPSRKFTSTRRKAHHRLRSARSLL